MKRRLLTVIACLTLCAVAAAVIWLWVAWGIPYYADPPQPPYDQPFVTSVPLLLSAATGFAALVFIAVGLLLYVSRRRAREGRN